MRNFPKITELVTVRHRTGIRRLSESGVLYATSYRKTWWGNSNCCFLEGDRFIPDCATGIDPKWKHRVLFKTIHHFMMEIAEQATNYRALACPQPLQALQWPCATFSSLWGLCLFALLCRAEGHSQTGMVISDTRRLSSMPHTGLPVQKDGKTIPLLFTSFFSPQLL